MPLNRNFEKDELMEQVKTDLNQTQLKQWQTPELHEFDINEMTRNNSNPGDDGCGIFTAS